MAKPQYYTPEDEITFNIIDENTVEYLQREGDIDLPRRQIDVPKDERWNTKLMSSRLLEGIMGGYSIPTIANTINQVINTNAASATRNARTMVTGAENVGRLDSYQNLANQGVVQKKIWMATADDRTRDSHFDLDGQERDIDKAFSNGLMYPGDPKGDPSEVWNCRCTMRDRIVGFRRAGGSISEVEYERDRTTHDEQIEEEKERRANGEQAQSGIVQGKDILDTWKRRSDEFDFEIEDVINAQGFDGLPRVVNAEEFDQYVQESNFIAQRTYSAPDQETLNAYRDQLYNGKWYVDCSKGGSAFGQGMYGFYDNGTQISDTITRGIDYYSSKYGNAIRGIETFTLDKSAKLISFDEISRIAEDIKDAESIWGTMDEGVAAVLKGYDGILAKNNEIVVLNRTKVIFKGE